MGNLFKKPSNSPVSTNLTEEDIQMLLANTSFDREQIHDWHRGFLKDCPKGSMNKEKFIEVYGLLYPNGNAQKFSKQVFRVFDRNNSGLIDFKELMLSISVTTAGDLRKKIELAFTLFDLNQNGLIEEKEMITIIEAIFELLDYDSQKRTGINSAKERVKCIIQQLDKDNDNCLSKEEFIEGCMNDPVIRQLLVPVS